MHDGDDGEQDCQARIGTVLSGKWTLVGLLGVGGMAAVYSGRHRNGAVAAIKLLHAELSRHPEIRQRFLREAYIANKVEHPGCVKVLDDDITEQGELYLVMELLRGSSVEGLAARNAGRLPVGLTLGIIEQLLSVLEKAHEVGIVHRDLKPDNLFLTDERQLKVLDFGIARLREGADIKQTATGVLMGTPAFMAPEQALGRTESIGQCTDIWAVGGILFTLLTGRGVHPGTSPNEMMINAATRPAQSLARVVQAPISLVKVVDRALEFEVAQRFATAADMRAALLQVMEELGVPLLTPVSKAEGSAGRVVVAPAVSPEGSLGRVPVAAPVRERSSAQVPVAAPATQAFSPEGPSRAGLATAVLAPNATLSAAQRPRASGADFDVAAATPEDSAALRELFTAMERALVTNTQYGKEHPEVVRRFERLFSLVASGLMRTDIGLVWNVTPYSFSLGSESIWEPKPPFDRVPYQLFSDGIRMLGLVPGLGQDEFITFLKLITLDPATEVAPEDDFVTMLWDADFEHVVHQAIDSFAEGNQEQRANFERGVEDIVGLAQFDTSLQLEDCWQELRKPKAEPSPVDTKARLLRCLSGGYGGDAESFAKAAAMELEGPTPSDLVMKRALEVDGAMLRVIATRLGPDVLLTGDRFSRAAVMAFRDAELSGNPASVAGPLRAAIDGLSLAAPEMAIAMIEQIAKAFESFGSLNEFEGSRAALIGAMVSKRTIEHLLAGAERTDKSGEATLRGLTTVLQYLDATHVPGVIAVLTQLTRPEVLAPLIAYLGRLAHGHEDAIAAQFLTADEELGVQLVRVLVTLATPAARASIMVACKSPHAVVRIEALGQIEGASSERLRTELRSLLEDKTEDVRVAALKAMVLHQIRIAGPYLVLRIKSSGFDKLSKAEKREALATVYALAPQRAEALALELAADSQLMGGDSHDVTRELAAEVLGKHSRSPDALKALREISGKRWGNSDRVRATASVAVEQIEPRTKTAPAPTQAGGRRA